MEERTRAYLRGRFRDYYRRADVPEPPAAERREWGYIPWSAGGTTMVRHRSLYDLGELADFLQRERPRHAYFSAGYYRDPGAGSMGEKGWLGSDLIFDLDADHLPAVDPEEDTYAEMLSACKDSLRRLLDFLLDDFGFDDVTVVFSGGRGYHVHVRDDSVRELDRDARREVVDYVRGIGVDFEQLVATESVAGDFGRSTPAENTFLPTDGGWGVRAHELLLDRVDEVRDLPDEEALSRLREYDGIGEKLAERTLESIRERYEAIAAGNVSVHNGVEKLARESVETVLDRESAAIDEPVTTDTHRLIRLPGSLHGGTGLRVTPISVEELDDFDPLVDAVPEAFVGHEIAIRGDGGPPVELRGKTIPVPDGVTTMPEYAAVFLMAGDRAEKERE